MLILFIYIFVRQDTNARKEQDLQSETAKKNSLTQPKIISFFKTTDNETLQEFICRKCQACFLYPKDFTTHCEVCEKYLCNICKKVFLSAMTYKKHLKSNCPPKRHMCTCCKKTFSRKSDKDHHERKCS